MDGVGASGWIKGGRLYFALHSAEVGWPSMNKDIYDVGVCRTPTMYPVRRRCCWG